MKEQYPAISESVALAEHGQKSDIYSTDYVAALMINSFRFSQGDIDIQQAMLRYLASRFHERFVPETVEASEPMVARAALVIVNNASLHPERTPKGNPISRNPDNVASEVHDYIESMALYVRESQLSPDALSEEVMDIVCSIVEHEFNRLGITIDNGAVSGRGRLRKQAKVTTPKTDVYLSHWVYYGLLGQSTYLPEYDTLFADMVKEYRGIGSTFDDAVTAHIHQCSDALLQFHLMHHPEQGELFALSSKSDH